MIQLEDSLLKAQPVEQSGSGIFRRCQSVQDPLATARGKIKAAEECAQVDDTKIAEL